MNDNYLFGEPTLCSKLGRQADKQAAEMCVEYDIKENKLAFSYSRNW